jgi:Flp pilus assembly protein TadG
MVERDPPRRFDQACDRGERGMPRQIARRAEPHRLTRLVRCFIAERKGAVALEFAIVAFPFFALLFTIFEVAYLFLAGQSFDTSLETASRQILTGSAQQTTGSTAINSQASFITYALCPKLPAIITCSQVQVNVAPLTSFSQASFSAPISNGQLNTSAWGYKACTSGQIVKVEAIYPVTALTSFWTSPFTITANGTKQRVLYASTVFKCEPF